MYVTAVVNVTPLQSAGGAACAPTPTKASAMSSIIARVVVGIELTSLFVVVDQNGFTNILVTLRQVVVGKVNAKVIIWVYLSVVSGMFGLVLRGRSDQSFLNVLFNKKWEN